jgi:hypothetical protein
MIPSEVGRGHYCGWPDGPVHERQHLQVRPRAPAKILAPGPSCVSDTAAHANSLVSPVVTEPTGIHHDFSNTSFAHGYSSSSLTTPARQSVSTTLDGRFNSYPWPEPTSPPCLPAMRSWRQARFGRANAPPKPSNSRARSRKLAMPPSPVAAIAIRRSAVAGAFLLDAVPAVRGMPRSVARTRSSSVGVGWPASLGA